MNRSLLIKSLFHKFVSVSHLLRKIHSSRSHIREKFFFSVMQDFCFSRKREELPKKHLFFWTLPKMVVCLWWWWWWWGGGWGLTNYFGHFPEKSNRFFSKCLYFFERLDFLGAGQLDFFNHLFGNQNWQNNLKLYQRILKMRHDSLLYIAFILKYRLLKN